MTRLVQSVIGAWLLAVLLAVSLVQIHSAKPGEASTLQPQQLSKLQDLLGANQGRKWVLVFLNPQCPCSIATLENVQTIKLNHPGKVAIGFVGVYCKDHGLLSSMTAPNGNNEISVIDPAGILANDLGIKTSGHVVLIDENGQLLFSGGITAGRGHRGDCRSFQELVRLINTPGSQPTNSVDPLFLPVWGCDFGFPDSTISWKPADAY